MGWGNFDIITPQSLDDFTDRSHVSVFLRNANNHAFGMQVVIHIYLCEFTEASIVCCCDRDFVCLAAIFSVVGRRSSVFAEMLMWLT